MIYVQVVCLLNTTDQQMHRTRYSCLKLLLEDIRINPTHKLK